MDDEFYNQTNISIKNISTVFQYRFKIKEYIDKVLTVFGEYHNVEIPCKEYNISVIDYITRTLKLTNNIKVFLEYDNMSEVNSLIDPINGIKSINIKEILNGLNENDRKKYIIPVDCRNKFLQSKFYYELYHNLKINTNKEYIKTNYIDKFFNIKIIEYPNISIHLKNVLGEYMSELSKYFSWILDNWDNIKPPTDYTGVIEFRILYLRIGWANVVDYYILEEIFKNDETSEYICIIGDIHRQNIQKYLETLFGESKIYHQEVTKNGDCVSLNKMKYGPLVTDIIDSRFQSGYHSFS